MYIPIVSETKDETIDKVIEAIVSDERLKGYSPTIMIGTKTNIVDLS